MLIDVLAHAGQVPGPDEVWRAWNLQPVLIVGLVAATVIYRRGMTPGRRAPQETWRARSFAGGLLALAVALLTPLESISRALASAHMVQHLLLVLVAAPLLAFSAPASTLLRGSPLSVRRAGGRWRRRLGLTSRASGLLRHPVTVWLLHVATLWLWHSAALYDAALRHEGVHIAEHATFLGTGVLFWSVVIGGRGAGRVSPGLGIMLVFATGMQSVFLSVLLTFARTPWYDGYATTTRRWGLEPLADQQLAGVIMWVPAGLVHVLVALALLAAWLRATERAQMPV